MVNCPQDTGVADWALSRGGGLGGVGSWGLAAPGQPSVSEFRLSFQFVSRWFRNLAKGLRFGFCCFPTRFCCDFRIAFHGFLIRGFVSDSRFAGFRFVCLLVSDSFPDGFRFDFLVSDSVSLVSDSWFPTRAPTGECV